MGEPLKKQSDREHYELLLQQAEQIKGVSLGQDAWKRIKKNRVAMLSLCFLILLSVSALFTPLLPLQSPREVTASNQFQSPTVWPLMEAKLQLTSLEDEAYQNRLEGLFGKRNFFDRGLISARIAIFGDYCIASICGTDELGRDLLSRLFWGARISLLVGVVATFVSLIIGVSYGAISGYIGGVVDDLMMRLIDVGYSIPFIFVVIFLITILDAEGIKDKLAGYGVDRITIFFILIGAIYWLTMARVVRGQVMSLKQEQFIEAARTIGAGRFRIIFKHLIPNTLSVVIVYLTLTIPSVMLFEAFLSFLGLGVEPPEVSWGLLAWDGVRAISPLKIFWWLVVFPGLALSMTLFALNFLGDGLRDALDPRMKNKS